MEFLAKWGKFKTSHWVLGESRTCLLQQPWLVNYSSVCNWNTRILKGLVTKGEVRDQRASSKTGRLTGLGEPFSIHLHLLCLSAEENWVANKWSNAQIRVCRGGEDICKISSCVSFPSSGKHRFEAVCSETYTQPVGTYQVSMHNGLRPLWNGEVSKDQERSE